MTDLGELAVTVEGVGPPAVLWHSLFVDDHSWDGVAGDLARQRRLIRIDGPSHGDSATVRSTFTLDDCARAALAALDALEIEGPVDWVGNAWGGHVGIVLAASHPDRVRSLVAFSAPIAKLTDEEASRSRLLARIIRLVGPIRPAVDGVVSALLSERTRAENPDAVAYVRGYLRSADRRGLVTAIQSISLARPDLTPLLPKVLAPAVLVVSPEGTLWTPAQAEAACALMPNATVAVVPDTLHLAPLERPAASAAIITDLWSTAHSAG